MRSRKTVLIIALLLLGSMVRSPAAAQSTVQTRDVLTNRAVMALAAAGFSEDFLIELIRNSRTGFDASVDGLAALAKQGISERVIRAMLSSPAAAAPNTPAEVPQLAASSTSVAPPKGKPAVEMLAIFTHTPYDVSSSFFWGFYTRHVGLGVSQAGQDLLAPHLGTLYGAALSTGAFVPIAH